MELSKRLRAVAGLVTEGASVADIGTDHGYIPIYLVQNNIAAEVIASDVNEGPLQRARIHIQEYEEVRDKINIRRSDGLNAIKPGEADTMIAAGMGGGLIIKILEEGKSVTDYMHSLILQPQSEIERVRSYLNDHALQIVSEDMVEEEGKYYPMMKAIHGRKESYTKAELLFGKQLLKKRHPVLKEYLLQKMRIKKDIVFQLIGNGSQRAEERRRELERELRLIEEALEYYREGEEVCCAKRL